MALTDLVLWKLWPLVQIEMANAHPYRGGAKEGGYDT